MAVDGRAKESLSPSGTEEEAKSVETHGITFSWASWFVRSTSMPLVP